MTALPDLTRAHRPGLGATVRGLTPAPDLTAHFRRTVDAPGWAA